jgi:DNA-directed RNA polymerase specialized sigma24 family protein
MTPAHDHDVESAALAAQVENDASPTSVPREHRPVARGHDPSIPPCTVADLLDRMRAGDRAAAAIFVRDYGARIRRRVRGKLSPAMRRLFDSQEILSTLGRRLDLFVLTGRVEATTEAQLWALVFRAADNALIDKHRAIKRLRAVEGEDSPLAQRLLSQLRSVGPESDQAADIELQRVFLTLDDPLDRTILALWFNDTPRAVVSEVSGLSIHAVDKRWTRIKARLRTLLEPENS